jgi:hypothetical protein
MSSCRSQFPVNFESFRFRVFFWSEQDLKNISFFAKSLRFFRYETASIREFYILYLLPILNATQDRQGLVDC